MAIYYVGWDVGAWYCDKNSRSRDAIYVLDENKEEVASRRQVIRRELNDCNSIHEFLNKILGLSTNRQFNAADQFVFAIDAVFSFPYGVTELLAGENYILEADAWGEGKSIQNSLLFRYTERFVAGKIRKPLSVIQDSIGSQSTKAMYFLRHFQFKQENVGIWETTNGNIAIETYPSIVGEKGKDLDDARICANLAWQFMHDKNSLYQPDNETEHLKTIKKEGWIWFPQKEQ